MKTGHVDRQDEPQSAHLLPGQVEKILHSSQFNGSELLRNLLSYLARRALERPGESAKEYDVAVDVLGRAPGFDPRLDSAVRVHTARLRAKLAEYYMSEGAEDPVMVEVPKGAYLILWHQRNGSADVAPLEAADLAPTSQLSRQSRRRWFAAGFAAAVILGCAVLGIWLLVRPGKVPAPVQAFWRPFLGSAPDPIVVFSNHQFIGTSSTGLHSFREGVDAVSEINDTYSGTGTVMAVHELGQMFSRFGRMIRLKRAELLTWDEAQTTNLIFVGSPEANSRLRQLAPLHHFDFKSSRCEPRLGFGGIVNLHPAPGEEPIYYGPGNPYTSDYAVIAMLPGMKPGQRILILAGTNTYGVQAAAEFICRADLIGDLFTRLGAKDANRVPDFEALVEVKVSGGVPVHSRLVLTRLH